MARRTDHRERRELFAAGALRVIMRAGLAGLTVREVAKEAGFTTGALTHYFTSKDQMLIEASEYSAKLVRPGMERSGRDAVAADALRRVVRQALPHNAEMRGFWRVWFGFWERAAYNADVARVMRARYDEWRGRLRVIIARAQAQQEAPGDFDPDLAAQELVALVDGIAIQALLGVGGIPAARQRALVDRWIENMIAGRAGRDAAPAKARLHKAGGHKAGGRPAATRDA